MYGYRQMKDLFNKNKWTILIAVWSTAIICLHLRYISSKSGITMETDSPDVRTYMDQNRSINEQETTKPTVRIKYYDVLLNSYMRSGSTLTGIILGWRDDSFYLYEPLWKISRWTYWHGNDTVCRSDRLQCRKVEPGKAIQDRTFLGNKDRESGGSLVLAMKILRKIYDCLFNDFDHTVVEPAVTVKLGGPSWTQMMNCMKNKIIPKLCLHRNIPRKCKNATHRVTKVLRLSTDLLAEILQARDNLKVIHLFRDPRAIINSRIQTKWYPTHSEDEIIENAKSLCSKMLYDFEEGKKLLKLYPDRFKFIYYEDLNENPLDKSKELYKYLGMDLDENKYQAVKNLPVFSNAANQTDRQKNTAFWWRMSLKWDIVQKMEAVCGDVYKELGYRSLTNLQEYGNISISSFNIPKEYLIIN